VDEQLLEDRLRAVVAVLVKDDGEPQRLARARRDLEPVLERAEDAARRLLGGARRDLAGVIGFVQRAALHPEKQLLLARRDDGRVRRARAAPPAHPARLFAERADEARSGARTNLLLRLAVEPLADQERPRKHADADRFRRRVVHGDVDDERDDAVVPGPVRNEERFADPQVRTQRELADLRVRQEGELALDVVREERRVVAGTVGDLVRSEDDLIGVRVPQAADPALGRRLREAFEVREGQSERRLALAEHVGAELVALSVEGRSHGVTVYPGATSGASSNRAACWLRPRSI